MLQKLDIHPYLVEIDLCEHLLKYCNKHMKKEEQDIGKIVEEADKNELEEKRKQAIDEALNKGKLERGKTKEEKEQE